MKSLLVALTLTALALAGCSGDGSISLPTAVPTSLPSGLPTATATSDPSPTDTPTTTPTETESSTPTPTVTETTTATATATATVQPTPTATSPDATEPVSAETDGLPTWAWVLLLLLAGLLIGFIIWAVGRNRTRKAWDAQLNEVRMEANWALVSLLPAMLAAPSAVQFQQAWAGGRDRFLAADRSLFELSQDAPDDSRARDAASLKDAFAGLRQALDAEAALSAGGGSSDDLRAARASVEQARAALADAASTTHGPKHA